MLRVAIRVVKWRAAVAADGNSLVFVPETGLCNFELAQRIGTRVRDTGVHPAADVAAPVSSGGGCFDV